MSDQIIVLPDNTAYLAGAKAAVTFANSAQMFEYKDLELLPFQKNKKKYRGIVPWGDDNDLPDKIIESVYKNPVMTSGMLFNLQIFPDYKFCIIGSFNVFKKINKNVIIH